MKRPGAGRLFAKDARSEFLRLTGSRYDSMAERIKKKKLPPLRFTKDDFRDYVLRAFGSHYDGVLQCRYCRKFCTLAEVSADHEMPLSRGGSSDVTNLGFPCQNCNQMKGSLTPGEFLKLIEFCETQIPLGRRDVYSRLAKANKLAAGARRVAMLLAGKKVAAANINMEPDLPEF
jgi:HNH endonuclease